MRAVIFVLLTAVMYSFNAAALAVASDYLDDNTLLLEDETSKLYGIRLQNSGANDVYLRLTYDDTISKVIGYQQVYKVPPKESTPVVFNITAPKNARPDDIYEVSYTVAEVSPGGEGIPILLKINKSFNVKIIKNPNKFYLDYTIVKIFSAMALAFLLYAFRNNIANYWKNRNKTPKKIQKKEK